MKKVVFLSWHYYNSKRQAGFHFLAKAIKEKGFQVVFINTVISLLTYIRKDLKIYEKDFNKNVLKPITFNGIKSIVNLSIIAPPISRASKILEFLSKILYRLNRASIKEIRSADYVVFESAQSILFFDKIKSLNPNAKLIYRMSDDMEIMKSSKIIIKYERSILVQFDLVSVPTKTMYDKFKNLSFKNVKLQFHGIDKSIYDSSNLSPYTEKVNHVFIGNSHLDQNFLKIASNLYKDHYFHVIGAFDSIIKNNNVIYYGHMSFEKTIPYVKFATTGLQTRSNEDGIAETLSDSLKVLQYSYCKLPIIAPSVIPAHHRKNFFYFNYDDIESIRNCIDKALKFDKSNFKVNVQSWDELALDLIKD